MMLVDVEAWRKRREATMRELEEHLRSGRVDGDIRSLLQIINSLPYAFTASSCSGRIQLYEAREPGEKFSMRTLAKWHSPIEVDDLLRAMEGEDLWLAVLPPILHIVACSLEAALHLLEVLRGSGFKRAGVISVARDGATVETSGTERLEMPLRLGGRDIVRAETIPLIVERANSILVRSRVRIRRLEEVLGDEVAGGLDNLCG